MRRCQIVLGIMLIITIHVTGQALILSDEEGTRQVKWNPDGTMLATANPDGKVRIWEASGELLAVFVADSKGVKTVDWHPDGTRLASAGTDGFVRIWEVNGTLLSSFDTGYYDGILELLWHPDGTHLVTLGFNVASVWDSSTGQFNRQIPSPGGIDMNFSTDGIYLAIIASTDRIWIYDADDFSRLVELQDTSRLSYITWSPHSTTIASGDYSGTVKLWDVETGTNSGSFINVDSAIEDIAWSPDGTCLAVATSDGKVYMIDSQMGAIVEIITASGPVLYLDWQPSGTQLAYVVYDGDADPVNDLQIVTQNTACHMECAD